ncbi:MAG: hypothetical protein LC802_20130 [Acidobacteria bacterium]|nr:hypothetical protein [Acidobacteriota bacterium]
MTEEERERTMNFILEQQAHFAAGMQRLEVADARADRRLSTMERTVVLMIRQFRRERRDLRERVAALVDAQIKSEDRLANSDKRLTRIEEMAERNIASSDKRLTRIEEMAERNSANSDKRLTRIEEMAERNIASSDKRLTRIEEMAERNSVDIGELAQIIARKQNGDGE